MTARSEPAALAAIGARLRAAGATPAPKPAPRTHADVGAGIVRLRALLSGTHADEPELTPEQLRAYAARYQPAAARRALGRFSGWREVPQCGGCKRILKRPDDVCPNCGYAGHGGYVSVPAPTSHLERWR